MNLLNLIQILFADTVIYLKKHETSMIVNHTSVIPKLMQVPYDTFENY